MKKPFILIAIIASFVCVFIACSNSHKNASSAAETEIELTPKEPWHGDCQSIARNNEAFGGELATENESTLDESCEPEIYHAPDIEQTTIQHKESAYQNMVKAGTLDYYFADSNSGPILDLEKFLTDLGLDYEVSDETIRIAPNVPYSPNEDYEYVIRFGGDMIRGNDAFISRTDSGWKETEHYDSATDFIFLMALDRQIYYIGCDELDVMYRSLRVLTTPLDKVAEVNDAIDAELNWSDEPTIETGG